MGAALGTWEREDVGDWLTPHHRAEPLLELRGFSIQGGASPRERSAPGLASSVPARRVAGGGLKALQLHPEGFLTHTLQGHTRS